MSFEWAFLTGHEGRLLESNCWGISGSNSNCHKFISSISQALLLRYKGRHIWLSCMWLTAGILGFEEFLITYTLWNIVANQYYTFWGENYVTYSLNTFWWTQINISYIEKRLWCSSVWCRLLNLSVKIVGSSPILRKVTVWIEKALSGYYFIKEHEMRFST